MLLPFRPCVIFSAIERNVVSKVSKSHNRILLFGVFRAPACVKLALTCLLLRTRGRFRTLTTWVTTWRRFAGSGEFLTPWGLKWPLGILNARPAFRAGAVLLSRSAANWRLMFPDTKTQGRPGARIAEVFTSVMKFDVSPCLLAGERYTRRPPHL